jgi:hypothetical protein
MTKKVEPPKKSKGPLLLVGGLAIAGAYGLAQCLSDDAPKFKPWTGEQKASAYRKCVSSALARDGVTTCVANSFCQCATTNYESRGTPYEEFTGSLLGAVTSYADGTFGYFCTDVAKNQCGRD